MTTAHTIPQSFARHGFQYRLIEQLYNAGIYEQTHDATGRVMAYEVLIIREMQKDRTFPNGDTIPAGTPIIPYSEQWGTVAWTCRTLSEARIKLTKVATNQTNQ